MQVIVAFILAHQWVFYGMLVVGLIVRAFKTDVALTATIPAKYRPFFALALGVTYGVLQGLARGIPALDAILTGMGAASGAVTGHDLIVNGLRNGRDLFEKKSPPAAEEKPVPADPSAAGGAPDDDGTVYAKSPGGDDPS